MAAVYPMSSGLSRVASGPAMIPHTIIKEANPPESNGTSIGPVNFLRFTANAPAIALTIVLKETRLAERFPGVTVRAG